MNRVLASVLLAVSATCVAQSAPQLVSSQPFASDEYLLLGNATRGAGEPMIAVDPTNPKNMIAVAMGNLQRIGTGVPSANMTDAYHAVPDSTYTWLAVTHDGGVSWKIGELPARSSQFTRCPDSFAAVTKDGTFLAGCEPRETSGDFFGESAVLVSTDKGETWSKPVEIVSSYSPQRFAPGLKPRIGGNSPWDRPFLYIDDSTGVIYGQAGGGETELGAAPGKFRPQSYVTASTDGGKSFGTIYAWDTPEYQAGGRGRMTAANGEVAVVYIASKAPSEQCPCVVFGISRDQGKTFTHLVLKDIKIPPPPARPGAMSTMGPPPGGPNSVIAGLSADQKKKGHYALLIYDNGTYKSSVTDDSGMTWSPFIVAGRTPDSTVLVKPWFEFSRDGVLGLMWRAVYSDRTFDIWATISRDGGRAFAAPLKVSHERSLPPVPARNAGFFGDDINDLTFDTENMHMVWGDTRGGFQSVWYGRVPLSAFTGTAQ